MIRTDLNHYHNRLNPCSLGSLSQSEHIIHIYENDRALLDTLEQFVVGGLRKGESVIAVATASHLAELNETLNSYGVDMGTLREHFFCLDAGQALAQFMLDGWPDERLFTSFVEDVMERATRDGRRVRIFGEMVAILWEQGNSAATVRLEQLWNKFCHTGAFPLLCAYPKSGFRRKSSSLGEILAAHTKLVNGMDWLSA